MLTTLEVIYSVRTSGQILVMSESTDADNAIVFVDTNWDKYANLRKNFKGSHITL